MEERMSAVGGETMPQLKLTNDIPWMCATWHSLSHPENTEACISLLQWEREREIDKDVEEGKECEKEREGQSMSNRKGKKWGETVCQAALQAQPIAKHEVGMA